MKHLKLEIIIGWLLNCKNESFFFEVKLVYFRLFRIYGINLHSDLVMNGIYTDEKLNQVIIQLLKALEFIHSKNIVHRDIKVTSKSRIIIIFLIVISYKKRAKIY